MAKKKVEDDGTKDALSSVPPPLPVVVILFPPREEEAQLRRACPACEIFIS